jgi:uncharacterized protein
MSVELKVLAQRCNLKCEYCYQANIRQSEINSKYDLNAMLKTADRFNENFTIYGGEPLLIPIKDLEVLWEHGFKKYKQNGLQTNGTLINDKHFEMFKQYNVHVGFSIDGPDSLNIPRGSSDRSIANLYRCLAEKIPCSLITVLHRFNCNSDLIIWFSELDDRGLRNVNIHYLENDNANHLVISQKNQILFMGWVYEAAQRFKTLEFDNFTNMIKRLYTGAGGVCSWNQCDPYNTSAVQGIGPFGELHNCGRTNQDGVDFIKPADTYPMRAEALRNTPQENGGCKDCKYFYACSGYCPGTGINHDWRNRTVHCETIKAIFGWLETKGNVTVTVKEPCSKQ